MTEKCFHIDAEGCSIRCKLYTDELSGLRTAIVYGHGFGGHKETRAAEKLARRLLEKNRNAALLTFDWPCHGEDVRKTLRLEDCLHYLRLVRAWTGERFPEAALFGCATSFGGYLFLSCLAEDPGLFRRTALRCPAVNMLGVIRRAIMTEEDQKRLARGKSVSVGFDRKVEIDREFLDSLRSNDVRERDFLDQAEDLLILHGTRDEIVPFGEVRDFADRNLIEFVPVEGADHRFLDPAALDRANARILSFFGLK